MDSVAEVSLYGMCVGCGACAVACSANVITMERDPETGWLAPTIDSSKCIECGLCLAVCPAVNWSNSTQSEKSHPFLGCYLKAYSAFATDDELRVNAASGGFVTGILKSLLKNGHIDGAVVSRRIKGDPFKSETILARTPEEIASCKGSIYSPVCFASVLEQLNRIPEDERWAVVGLPCHIQALALMKEANPVLAKKVVLSISLVCGHVPSHRAYKYSLKRLGLDESRVIGIDNRGDGWPGFLRIELDDGSVKRVPYGSALSWGMVLSSPLFTPKACHVCPDPGGYAADIMVCDAWLPRFTNDQDGVNLVLAKTVYGDSVIQKAQNCGDIHIEDCPIDDFIEANKRVFVAKTRNHAIAMAYLVGQQADLFHKNIKADETGIGFLVRLRLWFYYIHIKFSESLNLDRVAVRLPKAFLFYWKFIGLLKR
ncbi:MAG: hypothetical protein DRH24_08945 [Deltaproteobacteria bacterium]|nr:MAG: hypothetical protein DRH24_08945 [Deltaproteobacteria bacterium]